MTLQIATPGTFTTPGLPNLGVVGFVDTFARADSTTTLGSTEEPSRQWMLQPDDPASFTGGISGGAGYLKRTTSDGPACVVAESYAADGALDVTLSMVTAGWQREFGSVFRFSDVNNMWRFISRDGTSFRLVKYAGGSYNLMWTSTDLTPASGDAIRVLMDGPNIALYVNGVLVHSLIDSFNQDASKHGWYGNAVDTNDRVDSISMTAG